MEDIRLILTDIDGTILPYGQASVSRTTVKAFHAALDAGIRVGPATGRGYSWIAPFFGGDEACCATCVATNGSEAFLDGQKVHEGRISVEALRQVAERVRGVPGAGLLTFDDDVPLLVAGVREDLAPIFPAYAQSCKDVPDVPNEAPIKANLFFGHLSEGRYLAFLDELRAEVPALDFDVPQVGFANIMPHGSNKGTAIDILCERLGIGLDQVVVFGDNGNDLSMLCHVRHSVAVANASREAYEAARWHIGPCDQDSVADAIAALAKGAWPFSA